VFLLCTETFCKEEDRTERLKVPEKKENILWNYDSGADVLYISIGTPKKALGTDIGEGIISRVDPETNEVVGLTVLNFSGRILKSYAS
jgi:uncharacterized protein YuzE